MSLYAGQGLGPPPGFSNALVGWGGPGRVTNAPPKFGGYSPPTGWGGPNVGNLGQPLGGGFMGGANVSGGYSPPQNGRQQWLNDPRRIARDPRIARGVHPFQQQQGQGWGSPFRNALMQNMGGFRGQFGVPQQGYRTGSSYTQGQGPRYAPPVSPQQQGTNRIANFFQRQIQPTAPRTMIKPRGQYGRMY